MVSVVNTENITAFVKHTLGCNCPDEVLSRTSWQTDLPCGDIMLDMKINVGNRLLVYIATVNDFDSLRRVLPALVAAGIRERDGEGFNRLRLVLAASDISVLEKEAEMIFKSLDKDEKVHLHILPRKSIPQCPKG